MKLIDNESLDRQIGVVAEVAGYLWERGWAERNGGNISVNVTGLCADAVCELPAHLSVHDYLVGAGRPERAVVHTHPIELVAMTHNPEFLGKDVLTRLLWSMIPETRAFCPKGLGIVPYTLPGSQELADRIEAFDQIDVLSKSAKIYESARSMGFVPTGMSDAEMQELKEVFGL